MDQARYRRSHLPPLVTKNKVNHPSSPTSDEVSLPPQSSRICPGKAREGKTDNTSQEDGFLQDSPDKELSDSPVRRIAGSLGCDQQSSEWVSIMETPITPPGSSVITLLENTSTPFGGRMVSRQRKSKEMALALFTRDSKVKGMC